MISQQDLSLQMLAQLRLLDPSISAAVGTPERKIIDTVAQSLFDSQIDLDALSAALDIDSKYGANLDRFFRIFGFARQSATFATGYIKFSRITPSNVDIRIPAGVIIQGISGPDEAFEGRPQTVRFTTVYDVILEAGKLSVVTPIRCTIAGEVGNVAANVLQDLTSSATYGITHATNEVPTQGGKELESDNEFKIRFKNTIFRNLAGTQDQYMALSVATAYTTKANVIGPMSRYREYIQVPPVSDSESYDVDKNGSFENGNGNAGEYTTALSTIPFAKYIYAEEVPSFVSNGELGIGSFFFREDYDFSVNTTISKKNRGDTARFGALGIDWDLSNGDTMTERPNVTFKNVYTGDDASVAAVVPNSIVLFDYAYMSEASRNDIVRGITNAVDVFIDGGNNVTADTIIPRPPAPPSNMFIADPDSKFHYENYRRSGQPATRPLIGNVLTPLFWEPVTDLPGSITIDDDVYYKDVHYWAVEDVSTLSGTVRARSGIEWSTAVRGISPDDDYEPGNDPSTFTGKIATDHSGDPVGGQPIEVIGYSYDRNVVDLQAALEGAKQVTTDVLAHKAQRRYFKLDVSAMYLNGINIADTNNQIYLSLNSFLQSQYFGSFVQLSDLLNVIHNTPGIDNVRWSADAIDDENAVRVYECDIFGNPLTDVSVERIQPGRTSGPALPEKQRLFVVGSPTGGGFSLTWNHQTTAIIDWDEISAGKISSELGLLGTPPALTSVEEDFRPNLGVRHPVRSFTITWSTNAPQSAIIPNSDLVGKDYHFNTDFFLRDNELASLPLYALDTDTAPGLIIRPRAQNTWMRGI